MNPKSFASAAVLAAAAISVSGLLPTGANAATSKDDLQDQINAQLQERPGGVQISRNEIAYNDGKVVLSIPDTNSKQAPGYSRAAAEKASASKCPYGWSCFYQYPNYEGRRLQFRECGTQKLTSWGFGNRTSSWANPTGRTVVVYDGHSSVRYLWTEHPHTWTRYVGKAHDNRADFFTIYCR